MASLLLTACASAAGESPARSTTIRVHIGLFGGPLRPDGRMADVNAPAADAPVRVTAAAGSAWTSRTAHDGIAEFVVPPGRYVITSTYCGAPRHVTARAHHDLYVQIACQIP